MSTSLPSQHSSSDADVLCDRIDVHEDAEKNLVTATFELPGLSKDAVSIDVADNVLTVSGESRVSSEHNENGYAVRERRYGKFSRSLPVPQGVKVSVLSSFDVRCGGYRY